MRLPTNAEDRKAVPLATGLLDYFPDALVEVARVSYEGSKQHHPGEPVHWDRSKSVDHGTKDGDGMRHTAKMAWRALAMLQLELEAANSG